VQGLVPPMTTATRTALMSSEFIPPSGSAYVGTEYGWPEQHALRMPEQDDNVFVAATPQDRSDFEWLHNCLKQDHSNAFKSKAVMDHAVGWGLLLAAQAAECSNKRIVHSSHSSRTEFKCKHLGFEAGSKDYHKNTEINPAEIRNKCGGGCVVTLYAPEARCPALSALGRAGCWAMALKWGNCIHACDSLDWPLLCQISPSAAAEGLQVPACALGVQINPYLPHTAYLDNIHRMTGALSKATHTQSAHFCLGRLREGRRIQTKWPIAQFSACSQQVLGAAASIRGSLLL
jgi:hypothetical protein